ncbi:MAG: ABC transporter ATP-binding protein, partial [Polyangiaceae bacterium]|nr:ABC transporter ATP-binding protein [Polyangiaceae bacterium]
DCFGLIGPNGAGKTTAFSIIAGYLHPDDGVALVLDHDARATDALKGKLAVLPQDAMLPPYETVGEFLSHLAALQGIPLSDCEHQARIALKDVDGIDWWGRRCGKLSHGMAKRVGLAQAFLGNPEVVLLDEPTAGLDPRIAFEIRQLIKKSKGKCTLVISSHNLHELEEICDAAAILDHGNVVASGTMEELTAAAKEFSVQVGKGPVSTQKLEAIAGVSRVNYDRKSRTIVVHCDQYDGEAEDIISQVLWSLLQDGVRISGVSKGRGLEKRVMELTE